MKTFFNVIAISGLFVTSFFCTNQIAIVVKDMDNLMIEIKESSNDYNVSSIDGIIIDNTIVPGINGLEVDYNKSYTKMKPYGIFDANLLEYKESYVNNRLKDNLDKFIIGGNSNKRNIALVFLVDNIDNINKVLSILKDSNVEATFFLDGNYLENNLDILETLNNNNHTVGNFSYNYDYTNPSYVWIDTIVKRLTNQTNSYCIAKNKEQEIIDVCKLYNSYTITPTIYTEKTPLYTIRKSIKSGSIIVMPISDTIENELEIIVSSINSMGYNLVNLENLLDESNKQ